MIIHLVHGVCEGSPNPGSGPGHDDHLAHHRLVHIVVVIISSSSGGGGEREVEVLDELLDFFHRQRGRVHSVQVAGEESHGEGQQ